MECPVLLGRLRPSGRVEISPHLGVPFRLAPKQQLAESVSSWQTPGELELLSHRSTLSGKENGMGEVSVHDHESHGRETPPRRRDDHGRDTGTVTPPVTIGDDAIHKDPTDRGGDGDSSSES